MSSDALWATMFDFLPIITIYYPWFPAKEPIDGDAVGKLILESTIKHVDYPLKKLQVIVSFLEADKSLYHRLIQMRDRGQIPEEIRPCMTKYNSMSDIRQDTSAKGFWKNLVSGGDDLIESVDAVVASAVMADLPDFGGAFVCFPGKAGGNYAPEGIGKIVLKFNSKEYCNVGLAVYDKYRWAVARVSTLRDIASGNTRQALTFADMVKAVQKKAEVTWIW